MSPSRDLVTGQDALRALQWRVEPLTLGLERHLVPGATTAAWSAPGAGKPVQELPVVELWRASP